MRKKERQNGKELKRLIDVSSLDVSTLSVDPDLIRQVQHSREDREQGRVYGREGGLEYLQAKVKEFEHGQNIL